MINNNAHWPAHFRGAQPVEAFVVIPGSKSVTNRALILAAQGDSSSILRRPLVSRDSELMVAGLRALGVGIKEKNVKINGVEEHQWVVTPAPLRGGAKVDVGNAGTVMRFLPPLAALASGDVAFDGDPRSYERPLGPVIKALEELGVSIEHDGRYSLPMKLHGTGKIPGGALTIDASASSQFLSALLLVAPSFENGIVATHQGGLLPSMPHIEMTVDMLRSFGAQVEVDTAAQSWSVKAGKLHGQELVIEPDLSNAAPFLSLAMVCGGSVTIADWPKTTTQPGDQLRSIFTQMGAKTSMDERGLTLSGTGVIHGIDIDLHDVGELTPSIAAVAALADSPSHLRGIAHLRLHETDRLAALTREINALGGNVVEEESALHITPAPLHGGVFHTYDDHRLATAGAVLGLVVPGIEVENIATTRKTLPDFPGLWSSLLA
ncbi:3-phosphoshikimate 1-carboxyvinyltransferase 1 [Actinomycetes bacterium]|nr:3-phosphoshikimate 1-carboxyvinyltransferase 1 [Actinomycetes bacterium]